MTGPQQVTLKTLQREGFLLDYSGLNVIRLRRGNDLRLVRTDGTQVRASGARR